MQALTRLNEIMDGYNERNWHILVVTFDLNNASNITWPP